MSKTITCLSTNKYYPAMCKPQSTKYILQKVKQAFIHCGVWDCSQLLGVSC